LYTFNAPATKSANPSRFLSDGTPFLRVDVAEVQEWDRTGWLGYVLKTGVEQDAELHGPGGHCVPPRKARWLYGFGPLPRRRQPTLRVLEAAFAEYRCSRGEGLGASFGMTECDPT
jgi:hypothetical protein